MHAFLDDLLVGAALLASVAYAAISLGPRTLRPRVLTMAAGLLRSMPAFFALRGMAQRMEAAALKVKGACGGCDNCGSEQPRSRQAPDSNAAISEVGIPLAQIGRRPNPGGR